MPLADTLLRLAEEPALYIPKWSKDIMDELLRVLRRFGYSENQARRRVVAMQSAFPEAEVAGYSHLVAEMTNHPKDRHILAAAVSDDIKTIVTANVKDFRCAEVALQEIAVLTPDEFLIQLYRQDPSVVSAKIYAQAGAVPGGLERLLDRLSLAAPGFIRVLAYCALECGRESSSRLPA